MDKYLPLPFFLLLSFLVRLLFTGANIGEAIVIIALSCLYGFFHFLHNKKEPEVNKDLKNRLVEMEEQHKLLKDKVSSLNFGFNLKK